MGSPGSQFRNAQRNHRLTVSADLCGISCTIETDRNRCFPRMNEPAFLSGKVLKQTLPVFNGPTGPEAPPLKRLALPQGELTSIHNADEPIHYIAFIELRE